ncbi:MAG: hypothetical protein ACFB0A_07875, partial [Croceivirga sp.]
MKQPYISQKRNLLWLTRWSYAVTLLCFFMQTIGLAQNSLARQWNELVLESIRSDFARPTVHARNLFHSSLIMYDSWALFDD